MMSACVRESITEWSLGDDLNLQLTHPLLKKVFWICVQYDPSDAIPSKFVPGDTVEDAAKK